jgi:predicted small secreted protein
MKLVWILTSILIIGSSIGYGMLGGMKQQTLNLRSSETKPLQQPTSIEIAPNIAIQTHRSELQPQLTILLPLYIYPNWYDREKYAWIQVIAAAKKVPIVAIINPNNGPDNGPPNSDYRQGIQDLRQAGIKIVGYVPTNYANRDLQAVKNDINLYAKHFNIDGIFIDEAASTPDKLTYYRQIYQHIKSRSTTSSNRTTKPFLAIANPGTTIDESYTKQPIADITAIFENYQKVWKNYRSPAYAKYPNSQNFAVLIHTAADRKMMESILDRVARERFGYVYITNDSVDSIDRNPWNSLPDYWESQVDYIQRLNGGE